MIKALNWFILIRITILLLIKRGLQWFLTICNVAKMRTKRLDIFLWSFIRRLFIKLFVISSCDFFHRISAKDSLLRGFRSLLREYLDWRAFFIDWTLNNARNISRRIFFFWINYLLRNHIFTEFHFDFGYLYWYHLNLLPFFFFLNFR